MSSYERGAKAPDLATLERLLGAAGFELRMSLAPIEDPDDAMSRYEATLPAEVVARFHAEQRARRVG